MASVHRSSRARSEAADPTAIAEEPDDHAVYM